MDAETFDQIPLPVGMVAEELPFMRENDAVQLLTVDGKPVRCSCRRRSSWRSPTPSRASRATPCRT